MILRGGESASCLFQARRLQGCWRDVQDLRCVAGGMASQEGTIQPHLQRVKHRDAWPLVAEASRYFSYWNSFLLKMLPSGG